jgi:Flp pilus assembly protein TadG
LTSTRSTHRRLSLRPSRRGGRPASRGQTLVEFALVFPFFMVVLLAVIEFSFALNAVLAIDFASRDAALAAAEAGNADGADCSILQAINNSITAPANAGDITEVRIFKADANGKPLGPMNIYAVSGAPTCAGLVYHRTTTGYVDSTRCNELSGCKVQTTVDTIGVQITYVYAWHTPLHSLLALPGQGYQMTKANAMRMEPVL